MRSLFQLAKDLEDVSELSATLALELREIAAKAASATPAELFGMMAQLLNTEGGEAVESRPFVPLAEHLDDLRERAQAEGYVVTPSGEQRFLNPNLTRLKRGDQIYRVRTARPLEEQEKQEVRDWWKNLNPTPDQLSEEKVMAMKRAQARKYGTSVKVISGIIGGISSLKSQSPAPSPTSTPTTSHQSPTSGKVH